MERQSAASPGTNRRLPVTWMIGLLRLPRRVCGVIRRRPVTSLVVLVAVAVVCAAGVYGYAIRQWHAAQRAIAQERPGEARDRLAICLTVWPRNAEVWLVSGRAARLGMDLPTAEDHLSRALRLPGVDAEAAQLELLLVRLQGGELEEVTPTLIQVVESGSVHGPLILETLSRAYMHKLRYSPAYGFLSRWLDLRPEDVKAWYWRAWVLERLNNPKSALADYTRAIELDPNHLQARLRVAEMHLDDKQAPEALPHLEYLHRLAPNDPRVQARLGACWVLQGNGAEARPLLESAIARLPGDPALVVALSSLDVQDGRAQEAEQRLTAFLANEPSDTEALFVLSSAQRALGKTEEAMKTLALHDQREGMVQRTNDLLKAADKSTTKPDDFAELGGLLLALGRDKLGVYWLNRAVERSPTHQAANLALVKYYERIGDAAQALRHRQLLRDPVPPVVAPTPPSR